MAPLSWEAWAAGGSLHISGLTRSSPQRPTLPGGADAPLLRGAPELGDVDLPDMLTAMVARAPVFGGRVRSFDATAALAVPGVVEVKQVPSGVAVPSPLISSSVAPDEVTRCSCCASRSSMALASSRCDSVPAIDATATTNAPRSLSTMSCTGSPGRTRATPSHSSSSPRADLQAEAT
jgi:hypothetical protein